MSASNWAVCPRCTKQRLAMLDEMRAKLAACYGVVPVEEFDQMRQQVTECENMPAAATLREDYEFYGAEDGTVVAEYRCSCTKCGLESAFTHRHELDV